MLGWLVLDIFQVEGDVDGDGGGRAGGGVGCTMARLTWVRQWDVPGMAPSCCGQNRTYFTRSRETGAAYLGYYYYYYLVLFREGDGKRAQQMRWERARVIPLSLAVAGGFGRTDGRTGIVGFGAVVMVLGPYNT